MHPSLNSFLLFSLLILLINPKYMRPLVLASSSETKLFDLRSLPSGSLTFLGDSHLDDNKIILTKVGRRNNNPRSAGVVLYHLPKLFVDPHSKKVPSFHTMFAFTIDNINGNEEAMGDGLAFVLSADDDIFGSPGYLGLVNSTELTRNKFIAIEFDTKCDSIFRDPDDNHVGLDINSLYSVKLAKSSNLASLGVDLKGGDLITTWIDYKSNEKELEVFVSVSFFKPKKPLLKIDIDLSEYLKNNINVGFSSAADGSMQLARIEQWEFTIMEFSPPPPPPPESEGIIPNPSGHGHRNSHPSRFAVGLTVAVCSVPFMALVGWFCWKKLFEMIQKSEGTNKVEMQTIRSSRGFSVLEIQLSNLVDEVARGIVMKKMLDDEGEVIPVKLVKSSVPLCNSLPAVKSSILPFCNGMPRRTNDTTSV